MERGKRRTYGDGIPVLVHHHDTEEDTQLGKEQPINVVLDGITNGGTESKEDDHGDCPEGSSEDDVADGPAVLKRPENEDKLRDDVYRDAGEGPDDIYDPEGGGFGIGHASKAFECSDGEEKASGKHDEAGDTKCPQ